VAAAVCLATAQPAAADPGTDQIYQTLGVDDVAADYVVLVDVSGSMDASHLYGPVKSSLRALFASLAPQDEVTLVTFAGNVKTVWQGPIGDDPDAPIAALPPRADGTATDIGRALAASVTILNRPSAPPIGTVILLSDGLHQPAAGSPYPLTSGYAWDQLGRDVQAMHKASLSAYAIPLAGDTSVGLLTKVYGSYASVLSTASVDNLTNRLAEPKATVRAAKAAAILGGDLTAPVTAQWSVHPAGAGTATMSVTLRSATSHLPLQVTDLRVQACDHVGVSVPAIAISLPPGRTATVAVTLTWHPTGHSPMPFHTTGLSCPLAFTAAVSAPQPWADFLRTELHKQLATASVATTATVAYSTSDGSSGAWLAGILILAALVIVAATLRWRRAHPMLSGVLTATLPGTAGSRTVPLQGRRMTISAATAGVPGAGVVTAARAPKTREPVIRISYNRNGSAVSGDTDICPPGTAVSIGGVSFQWQPKAR
jgi:hypothetical protein